MGDKNNFDPYIAWEDITDEMVDDLHKRLTEYKKTQDSFLENKNPKDAARLLEIQMELSSISQAVHQSLFRLPVMVHVAGEKSHEQDEEDEIVVQRCTRCGSPLFRWMAGFSIETTEGPHEVEEDDIPWWDPGDRIAKAITGENSMTVYKIEEDHDLDEHELPCVDISGLKLDG